MLREIVRQTEAYLLGRCSTQELEGWLIANLDMILRSGDAWAIKLANELDADLMELGEGLMSEDEFNGKLKEMRLAKVE